MKLPGRDDSIFIGAAANVDHAGGTEIGPGELLFARPDELHRFSSGFCQTSGYDAALAGVFTAIAGAGVGHDDAHAVLGNSEGFGKFTLDAERPLRARPYCQLAVVPFRRRRRAARAAYARYRRWGSWRRVCGRTAAIRHQSNHVPRPVCRLRPVTAPDVPCDTPTDLYSSAGVRLSLPPS